MIVRIVKLTLHPDKTGEFFTVYHSVEQAIRNFEGCRHAELLTHIKNDGVVMTYSVWETEAHLEQYRKSELFKTTWARVKPLFASRAEAWTMEQHVNPEQNPSQHL
jgi:quinol monooxygenase YgiN